MKANRINWERHFPYLRLIYICFVFLYLVFLTRNAIGQVMSPAITHRPGIEAQRAEQQRMKVREIYNSQIGVREKQPNSGTQVEKYLKYVNLPKGNPWCAAFVCWVYGRAGVSNPKSGWSPALFGVGRVIWRNGEQGRKSKEQRLFPSVSSVYAPSLATGNRQRVAPGTGDIFGLFFPEKARIAHVGFIDEWKDPWVVTVEGNTNVLGSREGDGVYRKRRLVRSVYRVARYVE